MRWKEIEIGGYFMQYVWERDSSVAEYEGVDK